MEVWPQTDGMLLAGEVHEGKKNIYALANKADMSSEDPVFWKKNKEKKHFFKVLWTRR